MPSRVIVHLDLDCFYAQVEQRRLGLGSPPWTSPDSPPVAVQQWDSLIAVNYAARAAGVKRGMRATEASGLCPGLELVHVETIGEGVTEGDDPDRRHQKACLRRYREASEEVFAIVARHGGRCERASIDEAYLDLTAEAAQWLSSEGKTPGRLQELAASAACAAGGAVGAPEDAPLLAAAALVGRLREEVREETGFTMSAGIAESKLCAKLGSACHKPNRQTLVPHRGVRSFMESVRIKDLRGLGGKLGERLRAGTGLEPESLCAELMRIPLASLQKLLGEQQGALVWRLCQGQDTEEVKPNMKRKQCLSFKSFQPALGGPAELEPWLAGLAGELAERLLADASRSPRTLVVYHRGRLDNDHARNWMAGRSSELTRTISRSCPFPKGPPAKEAIITAARRMLQEKIPALFPCSRLALGASDFADVQQGPGLARFFGTQARGAAAAPAPRAAGACEDVVSDGTDLEPEGAGGGEAKAVAAAPALCGAEAAAEACEEVVSDGTDVEPEGAGGREAGAGDACSEPTVADESGSEASDGDVKTAATAADGDGRAADAPMEGTATAKGDDDRMQLPAASGPSVARTTPVAATTPPPDPEAAAAVTGAAAAGPGAQSLATSQPAAPGDVRDMASVASFHRASRLHFLGTWRERFEHWQKAGGTKTDLVVQSVLDNLRHDLASNQESDLPSVWAHLDMDCFFVSVATRSLPPGEGSEVPAAVTSGVGPSSEICSANYAARRLGVNTDLWSVERAKAVLPTLKIIPVSEQLLQHVEAAWQQVYQLLVVACSGCPDRVLMRSCDEAALEVTSAEPEAWASALRRAVQAQTGCTCSVGLGPSQLVAKLAVKACKPNGLKRVLEDEVPGFMADLPLASLPQVGRSFDAKLKERGLERCSDILAYSKAELRKWFGIRGETLWSNARGQDAGAVMQQTKRKTMSAEMNWGVRVQDRAATLKLLAEVSQQLAERLAASGSRASQLTLKLKIAVPGWVEPPKRGGHGLCDDVSRSAPLAPACGAAPALLRCATQLLDALAPEPARLRGIGLAGRLAEGAGAAAPDCAAGAGLGRWLRAPASGGQSAAAAAAPSAAAASGARPPAGAAPGPKAASHAAGSCGMAPIIDLESPTRDEEGDTCKATVACPVCGALQSLAEIEPHVNGHFEPPAPASIATSRRSSRPAPGQPARPAKQARVSELGCMLGASGGTGSDSDCELVG